MTDGLLKLKPVAGSSTEALLANFRDVLDEHQDAQDKLDDITKQLNIAKQALVKRIDDKPLEAPTPEAQRYNAEENKSRFLIGNDFFSAHVAILRFRSGCSSRYS